MEMPAPASSLQNRNRGRALAKFLSALIEHWEKYPDKLGEPLSDLTRTTLADLAMSWAEALFEGDHPIVTLIKYLGSVGQCYDQLQFSKEKRMIVKEEALEYAIMLREAVPELARGPRRR